MVFLLAKDSKATPKKQTASNLYDDDNIPDIDLPQDAEPLPESQRPRKDGPGGE